MQKLVGYIKIALLALAACCFSAAQASDLGNLGKLYKIAEADLLEVIYERLAKLEKEGKIAEIYKDGQERARQYTERPPGIYLPRATEYKAKVYDPTFTLTYDVKDAKGRVLIRKGTQTNPLDTITWNEKMCFINGDDREQVEWLLKYCEDPVTSIPVLVYGGYLDLMKELKMRLYFDQRGWYVNKLGIEALPTVVRQSGKVIYVEQFPIRKVDGEVQIIRE